VPVRLSNVHPDVMRDLLGRAWRLAAAGEKPRVPRARTKR
jgi:hypothetical protein